jgi:hypothetical protein
MVTRAQIDRIATRIEALTPKSNRVVYVWRNLDETEEEVLERHYRAFPADRLAAQTYNLQLAIGLGGGEMADDTHLWLDATQAQGDRREGRGRKSRRVVTGG